MKPHPIRRIYVSVTPEGQIKAKAYRGHSRTETLVFESVQDLMAWPEISVETPVEFRGKGLVPDLKLPCEPIFLYCPPDEIKEFILMTNAGDRAGWLLKYRELILALQAEEFDLGDTIGNRAILTDLIDNPKGYTLDQLIRRYEDGYFV